MTRRCGNTIHSNYVSDHRCVKEHEHEGDCWFGFGIPNLDEALEKLLEAVGGPWDIDQDCRYCSGHYNWHEGSCPWRIARAMADSYQDTKPHE